ncbi:hypothetical protein Tco_0937739 [Tanacetum coccineum]|uniref:Retrovirus-related Pol polyprotein from transposon TNT 1-94-like beta-barrel domain-containing protein n=1 Tax=Tanacetum coccineum TaxID=301880 RepID=A0ABQ5DLC5_9ASTR
MSGSQDEIPPPPPPPPSSSQTPTQQTPHTVSTIKLPILKKGEYDIRGYDMEHIWPIQTSNLGEEIVARERERKARTTLLMALPEDHLAKFHKMTDAKEMWDAIKSRFGGNDESKKMQKYILKQQFEGFSVSNTEGLHKGYDRFQSLLSQLEIHGAGVSTEDANQKFLRSLPSAWSQVSLIMRTKPGVDSLSFDDLYNNLRVFESDVKGSTASSSSPQNVAFVSENTSSTNEVSTAYCVPNPSGQNSQYEQTSSYSLLANQSSLLKLIGQQHSKKMKDFALMAYTTNESEQRCNSCSNKCKEFCYLKKLYDAQREQLSDASIEIKAYSQSLKKVEAYTEPSELVSEPVVNESNVECQPKVWSDAPIIEEYESDSEDEYVSIPTKEQETPSFANQQVKTPRETVKNQYTHSQKPKVDKKELGYGFTVRACFVCGSLNHLIRDCDFHEKRMARKAELNNQLNKNFDQREKRPIWNNVQRVNKQNQFVPSAVLTRTGKIPVNTARTSSTKNLVLLGEKGKLLLSPQQVVIGDHKDTTGIISPNTMVDPVLEIDYPHRALKNKGIVDSGCSRHMTGNKAYLAEFQDFNGGPVAFGGSKGYITGKGKIKTGKLDFEDVCFVKELQHFNLFSVSQMCDKKNKVLFTDSECLVLSPEFKLPDENQVLLKIPRQNNMYKGSVTQTTQPPPTSTIIGDDETIAKVLLNMSQAKVVSREKEKGVELKDIEETDRPRPTSTRSLLTLKPLPKIDPKDKRKKKIEEDGESESESDGIS